jgi:hypothetical protein
VSLAVFGAVIIDEAIATGSDPAGTRAYTFVGAIMGAVFGITYGGPLCFILAACPAMLNVMAIRTQRQGFFLSLYLSTMVIMCLSAALYTAHFEEWEFIGPLLLFLGLLALINAPFDWVALGLTRALLRRGLELKGWWPFLLALVDALCAAVIVALLALTMVIGVQTFDNLAMGGGGKPVLPLRTLFDAISAHAEQPEFWWLYALLISTMIPSIVNLVIGGTALMRAAPRLSPWLLNYLPATGVVRSYDRAWIAAVLTGQVALGAMLGITGQALLAYGLIFHAMPAIGLGLLDLARSLAALDLPIRLILHLINAE